MKHKFRTHLNSRTFPKKYEKNTGKSMTVPDQTMSIKEMLDRHVRGLPLPPGKQPIYYGEDFDHADIANMELTDKMDILDEQRQKVKAIQEELEKPKKPRKQAQNAPQEQKPLLPPPGEGGESTKSS